MSTLMSQINKNLQTQFSHPSFFDEYHSSLKLFWEGRYHETIEKLSDSILHVTDDSVIPLYYRLWVEVLAKTSDHQGLRLLQKHIRTMTVESEDKDSMVALQALIHLELDEIQACDLFSRATSKCRNNSYCLEFEYKKNLRRTTDDEIPKNLLHSKSQIIDYFHWESISQNLLLSQDFEWLDNVLSFIDKSFPMSPLKRLYLGYKCLEEGEFREASLKFRDLSKDYPSNLEFIVTYGYSLLCDQKLSGARDEFSTALDMTKGEDPDVLGLLAYSQELLAERIVGSKYWEQAKHLYIHAKSQLISLGLPCDEIVINQALMENYEKEVKKEPDFLGSEKNDWFVSLSSRSYFDMQDVARVDFEFLFLPLPPEALKGDLVFLGAFDKSSESYKILAIYDVLTPHYPHPTDHQRCVLKLMKKFIFPIFVPLQENQHMQHDRDGIFQLNSSAMDLILNHLKSIFEPIDEVKSSGQETLTEKIAIRRQR